MKPIHALAYLALAGSLAACGTTRPQVVSPEVARVAPARPAPTTWQDVVINCDGSNCQMTQQDHDRLLINLSDIERWVRQTTNLLDFYEDEQQDQNGRDEKAGSLDPR